MKKWLTIWTILLGTGLHAQDELSYARLLEKTPEIRLTDSIPVHNLVMNLEALDSSDVLAFFGLVLADKAEDIKFKNRNYYTAGKITSNPVFNLHVLVEDKKKNDSLSLRVIYLVTTQKNGQYISSLKAAVTGNRKKSVYNTSALITREMEIIQRSHIVTSSGSIDEDARYTIMRSGRFLLKQN